MCYIFLLKDHQLNNSLLTAMILQFFFLWQHGGSFTWFRMWCFQMGWVVGWVQGNGFKYTVHHLSFYHYRSAGCFECLILEHWFGQTSGWRRFIFQEGRRSCLELLQQGVLMCLSWISLTACHEARWPFTFPSRQFFGVATCLFLTHEKRQLVSRFASGGSSSFPGPGSCGSTYWLSTSKALGLP